jgi:hypothetical protein
MVHCDKFTKWCADRRGNWAVIGLPYPSPAKPQHLPTDPVILAHRSHPPAVARVPE